MTQNRMTYDQAIQSQGWCVLESRAAGGRVLILRDSKTPFPRHVAALRLPVFTEAEVDLLLEQGATPADIPALVRVKRAFPGGTLTAGWRGEQDGPLLAQGGPPRGETGARPGAAAAPSSAVALAQPMAITADADAQGDLFA